MQEKYNLELISVEDLINECIDIVQETFIEDSEAEALYGFIES